MQFQVGDRVVHPVHGVGVIKGFTKEQFGSGKSRQYYEVTTDGATVWVPVNEQGLTVLRLITSKGELSACRSVLKSRPVPLNKDHQRRHLEITNRLRTGSFQATCEIVRDLRALSLRKPLGESENILLRKTFKALSDEWAASAGVTTQVAINEIESLLTEAKHASTS